MTISAQVQKFRGKVREERLRRSGQGRRRIEDNGGKGEKTHRGGLQM